MSNVYSIHREGTFTFAEAQQLIPVLGRMSRHYNGLLDALIAKLEKTPPAQIEVISHTEKQINQVIHDWNSKVLKLGCKPRGLWIVDFDNGAGFYCWKFPEQDLMYMHSYDQEPRERRPILFD